MQLQETALFDGIPRAGRWDQASTPSKICWHRISKCHPRSRHSNPLGEGTVQEFHAQGAALYIASLDFGDPSLASSHTVQQQLSEVLGKPYSRMTIDLFLSEQLQPHYLQQGYLRVKLGPPEVRLTGNPNQKLPEQIPVFVPVVTGAVYHWKEVQWSGNSVLSSITLSNELGLKRGDVADGMQIEAGWDRARKSTTFGLSRYAIDPVVSYDDQGHTVSCTSRGRRSPVSLQHWVPRARRRREPHSSLAHRTGRRL